MFVGRMVLSVMLALSAVSVSAAPPVLRDLSPAGAKRGAAVDVALVGDLSPVLEVISSVPGRWTTAAPTRGAGTPVFRVEIPADAPCGYYPVRVRTAEGISAPRIFVVGDQAEGNEVEPNDDPAKAPPFKPPYTLNGRIDGADQDFFRFAAKAGDRWTFEVEARRLGSELDPMLRISGPGGKPIAAENDTVGLDGDARVEFVAPADGEYVVGVHDYSYKGKGAYRLRAGRFESPAAIFPLGGRRGWTAVVECASGLGAPTMNRVRVDAPVGAAGTVIHLNSSDGSTVVRPFAVSDVPEFIAPGNDGRITLTGPAVINGRLSAPRMIDRFSVVMPAGSWTADLDAIALGSPLDAIVTASIGGQAVGSASEGVTPRFTFNVPTGTRDVVFTVEDLHRRGGAAFVYRLRLSPARGADYRLQLLTPLVNIPRRGFATLQVKAQRNGYNEPIQLSVEGLAGVRASGGLIPAGATDGTLLLTADAAADFAAGDLQVYGNGGSPASPVRRKAVAAAVNRSPWVHPSLHWTLPAAITREPPIVVAWDGPAAANSINIVIGTNTALPVKLTRAKGADDAVTLSLPPKALPKGWESAPVTVAKSAAAGSITVLAKESTGGQNVPPTSADLLFTAKTKIGGQDVEVPLPPLRVTSVPPYEVEAPDATAAVATGGSGRLIVVIRRAGGFANAVSAVVEGLPAGVTAKAGKSDGNVLEIELTAAGDAKPGVYEATVKASARLKDRNYEFAAPALRVKVRVGSPVKPPASAAAQ